MKLFAAVFPPLPVRRDLRATFTDLPALEGLRLVAAENIHITMLFFGAQMAAPPAVARELEKVASASAPFEVEIAGASGFPASDRARVLFASVGAGGPQLSRLHDGLVVAIGPSFTSSGTDRFHPHLTLCRPRRRLAAGQFEALQQQARPRSWRFMADALHLVRSHAGPGGSRYEVLGSFMLAG